jgi:hypothetical protein
MKKLGTPIGSAPGSENENGEPVPVVTLDDVVVGVLVLVFKELDELLVVVVVFFFLGFVFVFVFVFVPDLPLLGGGVEPEPFGLKGWLCDEGCGTVPRPFEVGRCCEEVVELELELGLEDELEDEDEEEDEGLLVLVLDALEVVDGELQDSVSFTICAPAGSRFAGTVIAETGVPAGTSAVKLNVCPPWIVTVTTHTSAEALGTATTALTASIMLTEANAILSFRLLNTFACFFPPVARATLDRRKHLAARG